MSALYWNGSTSGDAAFWMPATDEVELLPRHGIGRDQRDEQVVQAVGVECGAQRGVAGDERDQRVECGAVDPPVRSPRRRRVFR